jgi:hypothetical protein
MPSNGLIIFFLLPATVSDWMVEYSTFYANFEERNGTPPKSMIKGIGLKADLFFLYALSAKI